MRMFQPAMSVYQRGTLPETNNEFTTENQWFGLLGKPIFRCENASFRECNRKKWVIFFGRVPGVGGRVEMCSECRKVNGKMRYIRLVIDIMNPLISYSANADL